MRKLHIAGADIELPKGSFLFIGDEVPKHAKAKVFDPRKRGFDLFKETDYRRSCDFVDGIDTLFERGENTLTKDTGPDFIAECLDRKPKSLERMIPPPGKSVSTGHIWAYGKIQRILRSPVLRRVLCSETDFAFEGVNRKVFARLNRAELGDFDRLAIGLFQIARFKGQIIVEDGGIYLRDNHMNLIREDRLIVKVNDLSELPTGLHKAVMRYEDQVARGVIYDDALELVKAKRLRPIFDKEDSPYNRFIDEAMA